MNDYTFSQTPYEGYEEEALYLRNNNRDIPVSRAYMDWRYVGQKSNHPPLIFWASDKRGQRVGMVGMVFRPYWVNGQQFDFAVIGDISLDASLRGKGIAKKLFEYMNAHIIKEKYYTAFVIPNIPAQKSLSSTGWAIEESIVPHVYIVNPWEKINERLKNECISKVLGKTFQMFVNLKFKIISTKGIRIENVDSFEEPFDNFWSIFNKKGIIIRERSAEFLSWRFLEHPYNNFKIFKFIKNNQCIGYIIYLMDKKNTTSTIYDLILLNEYYVKPTISLFVKTLYQANNIGSVRISLNQHHPYSDALTKVGFFKRKDTIVFQSYPKRHNADDVACNFFFTSSDKDT